jgi:hypothetical protein
MGKINNKNYIVASWRIKSLRECKLRSLLGEVSNALEMQSSIGAKTELLRPRCILKI